MGLLDRLRGRFGEEDDGPEYRCIRCGADLDKEYHTCPECGGQFVGVVEDTR